MDKNIIFLDIDGTLVGVHKKVSKNVIDAIHQAQENGHLVFICTGRPRCGVKNLEYIGFDGYICSAGSYIEVKNEIIFQAVLDREFVHKARNCFEKNHIFYNLETTEAIYQERQMNELFAFGKQIDKLNSEMQRLLYSLKDEFNIQELDTYNETIGVHKMSFIALSENDLNEARRQLSNDFHFIVHDSMGLPIYNGEIILKGYDKASGIQKVCQYLDISMDHTIAFGDSMNDLEMIQACRYGVVMENGNKELKTYASSICESVENDGIYHEFKRMKLI